MTAAGLRLAARLASAKERPTVNTVGGSLKGHRRGVGSGHAQSNLHGEGFHIRVWGLKGFDSWVVSLAALVGCELPATFFLSHLTTNLEL